MTRPASTSSTAWLLLVLVQGGCVDDAVVGTLRAAAEHDDAAVACEPACRGAERCDSELGCVEDDDDDDERSDEESDDDDDDDDDAADDDVGTAGDGAP